MRARWLGVVLALAGCDDGDEVQIGLRPEDPAYCEPTIDAAAPLGITGAQLFALFGAEFDTTVLRQGGPGAAEMQRLHVRIAPREEHLELSYRVYDVSCYGLREAQVEIELP